MMSHYCLKRMTNRCTQNNKINCKSFLCFRLKLIQVKLISSYKLLKLLYFFLGISIIINFIQIIVSQKNSYFVCFGQCFNYFSSFKFKLCTAQNVLQMGTRGLEANLQMSHKRVNLLNTFLFQDFSNLMPVLRFKCPKYV